MAKRSGLPIYSGPDILKAAPEERAAICLLSELYRTTTRIDVDDPPDSFVQMALLDYREGEAAPCDVRRLRRAGQLGAFRTL